MKFLSATFALAQAVSSVKTSTWYLCEWFKRQPRNAGFRLYDKNASFIDLFTEDIHRVSTRYFPNRRYQYFYCFSMLLSIFFIAPLERGIHSRVYDLYVCVCRRDFEVFYRLLFFLLGQDCVTLKFFNLSQLSYLWSTFLLLRDHRRSNSSRAKIRVNGWIWRVAKANDAV